jgi:glycerol-3-phosphate cytidylyltransferase|tara:strand:- start:13809 stop:14234 length:426 start_codon:yes stop_codon:yes gene_type:complete
MKKELDIKKGITAGAFDLLHAGHVAMFEEAKSVCDHLTVAIQLDPSIDRSEKNPPVQSIVERQIQVKAIRWVDDIIVYNREAELRDILNTLPLNIRIIGSEYKGKPFTGNDICRDRGIEIYYNSREHTFSSSELRLRKVSQ